MKFFFNFLRIILVLWLFINASFAQLTVNVGSNKTICIGDSIAIGGSPSAFGGTFPYTYSWVPSSGLSNSLFSNPTAFPTTTTTYVLTVKDAAAITKTASVTVVVGQIPSISAGVDTTIQEGAVAILHAHGGYQYVWSPNHLLKYSRTPIAEAQSKDTTMYYLKGFDITGACSAMDSVMVYVSPSNKIVLYNTFTPNGDNNNDVWYIGNIEKYPNNHLEIYNRYGKQVYVANGYNNDWGGNALGEKLPAATYFFILDLGDGSDIYHGTVTIVD